MLLAVYGTLKRGYGNHGFLEGSKYIGNYRTEPTYSMYDLGAFPAVGLTGNTAIQCELYEVDDPEKVWAIFRLEGYSPYRRDNLYNLHRINTGYGEVSIFYMKDVEQKGYKQIKSGIWPEHHR